MAHRQVTCLVPPAIDIPAFCCLIPNQLSSMCDALDRTDTQKQTQSTSDMFYNPFFSSGAYGTVYKARDTLSDTIVAIKKVSFD